MSKEVRDALLVASFFLGYALMLVITSRPRFPRPVIDWNRLAFGRTRREAMIAEENMVNSDGG